jgi:dimethylargininase
LEPWGVTVVGVPVEAALHLKSAATALPDGTIIGYEPALNGRAIWGEAFVAVPEEPGSHVVILDERTVLMSDKAPRTAAWLRDRGLKVIPVAISEYEALEGCGTCLSVRLRGIDA